MTETQLNLSSVVSVKTLRQVIIAKGVENENKAYSIFITCFVASVVSIHPIKDNQKGIFTCSKSLTQTVAFW